MTKKIISIISALALMAAPAAFAQTDVKTQTISEYQALSTAYSFSAIVSEVSENTVSFKDNENLVINIDENTKVLDYNLSPLSQEVSLTDGTEVLVIADMRTTRSLPAQSYGYYILVKASEEQTPPIFAEVGAVSGNEIASADGNYVITFDDNTVFTPFRTRNIVTADDLTPGTKILFRSQLMTMSIPALTNADEIVILEKAIDPVAELVEMGILLGTENGLELDREVTRAEAVTFIERINGGAKEDVGANFDDVASEHWAYGYISSAVSSGYVHGTGDNKFEPNRTVTATEFAKMLLASSGDHEVTTENAADKAIEAGLITTDELNTAITENSELTRNEVVTLCYNYIASL